MHTNRKAKGDSIARLTLTAEKLGFRDDKVHIRTGGKLRRRPGKVYSYKGRR